METQQKEKSIWEDEILKRGHSLGPCIAFTAWHLDVYRFKQVLLIMALSSIAHRPSSVGQVGKGPVVQNPFPACIHRLHWIHPWN